MVYGEFNNKIVLKVLLNQLASMDPKLAGEIITKVLRKFWFDIIIRPSAVYGPMDVNRRVVQIFMENAFKGKKIVLNGPQSKLILHTSLI